MRVATGTPSDPVPPRRGRGPFPTSHRRPRIPAVRRALRRVGGIMDECLGNACSASSIARRPSAHSPGTSRPAEPAHSPCSRHVRTIFMQVGRGPALRARLRPSKIVGGGGLGGGTSADHRARSPSRGSGPPTVPNVAQIIRNWNPGAGYRCNGTIAFCRYRKLRDETAANAKAQNAQKCSAGRRHHGRHRKHDPPPQKIWQSCLAKYCQAYENLAEIKKSGRPHPLLSSEQDL